MSNLASNSQPVFLVGAERSGTTLLRLMLDHHPDVAFHHESEFMVSQIRDTTGWPNMCAYLEWLREDRVFLHSCFEIDESLDYPHLMRSFLEQKRQRDGKPFVGATVQYGFEKLLRIWPEARFIHLVRDPRDVARSVVQMGWAGNTWCGAERWIEAENTWNSLKSLKSRVIEIRYCDLIEHCVATLKRICQFMSIPYDEQMLSYVNDSTYRLPDPKLVSQWSSKAGNWDIRLVEARVGSLLEARGFEPSGLPPLKISFLLQRSLEWHSHWGRARFSLRRYGLRLYVQEIVARRLHLKSLMERIRPEIRRIEDASLR